MKRLVLLFLILVFCVPAFGCQSKHIKLDPSKPVDIQVWTYYNGGQQEAFNELVSRFNESVGLEQGIVVEHMGQSGITELAGELLLAVKGEVGAQDAPNMAMVYPETALTLSESDTMVNLESYFSAEELSAYIPSFVEEGRLKKGGPLYILPVAKSTEILAVNQTDWEKFTSATGAEESGLSTIEGITQLAKAYYDWTDSLTPDTAGDGKAFFGRDAIDNYMFVGAAQLGHEIFPQDGETGKFQLDRETMRTLWDNYYIPFVHGYFAADGKFSSDDAKTGRIIAFVGSSSSVGYFPDKVTLADDSSYPIEAMVLPAPSFQNAEEPYSPQQGAGLCVLKKSQEEDYACSVFLKWFTAQEQNLSFALESSYMPVTIAANDEAKLKSAFQGQNSITQKALLVGAQAVKSGKLYIGKPVTGISEARQILKTSMLEQAKQDREAVLQSISAGESADTALQNYTGDKSFDAWYQATKEAISATVQ